jgi:RNA polymerase sigma factor (sigma-70 family)
LFQPALSHADIQALYLRCRSDLQLHIRRYVGCSETAKDLAQDLYFRLERLADRLPNEDEARRYLFQTAANMARDQFRVFSNRARLLEEYAPLQQEPFLDEDAAEDMRETLARIQALIEEMPERRQAIFMQSRLLGMTYREIAAEHRISPSLVEKEVAATMSALLRALARERLAVVAAAAPELRPVQEVEV